VYQLAVDNLSSGLGDDSDMMKRYAYVYKYDSRNRCIQKRIPGCDWAYFVYDKADRLALTQDGIQRPTKRWTVYKYDKLGRMLYSSVVQDKPGYSLDKWVQLFSDWVITEDFGVPAPYNPMDSTGYTRGFFSQPHIYPTRLLSVNYYDDYRFLDLLPAATKTALQYADESGYGTRYDNAKGLATGGRQYQLDDSTKHTVTATYYDYRGRVIQTKSTNHLGGFESEYIAYDFTGHPTQKKHVHTSPQAGTVTELYTYTYDHAGRPTETRHKLDGNAEQLLAKLSYDELGRVQNRKAGTASVVNTAYGYNVRSWTTGITGSQFSESLAYNYDGNIKQQVFGDNSSYSVTYNFVYDDLSRLTDATSDEGSYIGSYDCHYAYDKQGNTTSIVTNGVKKSSIQTIFSKSMITPPAFVDILYDNLTLAYNGNQLRKVTDAADVSTSSATEQFLDFANADVEYAYNANGAMTKDLNKGISSIQYNLLNLPQQIDILSPLAEARNAYSYSADGEKLRVVKKYNSNFNTSPVIGSAVNTSKLNVAQTTDYVDGKIFENNVLDRIFVDGGYIKNGTYYFYETDHLGDNRTVINQSGTVVERNDYYPYGMQMGHNDPNQGDLVRIGDEPNAFKFSGKELDVMGGLNLYDFEARPYDLNYIDFWTPDSKTEKKPWISPYVYCSDNPVNRVDPDGKWDSDVNGNLHAQKGDNTQTLAKFQKIPYAKAAQQLKEQGYTINSKGVLDLHPGDQVHSEILSAKIELKSTESQIENTNNLIKASTQEIEDAKKEITEIRMDQDVAGKEVKPSGNDPKGGLVGAYLVKEITDIQPRLKEANSKLENATKERNKLQNEKNELQKTKQQLQKIINKWEK
jgi:RHS repeat-associated protein